MAENGVTQSDKLDTGFRYGNHRCDIRTAHDDGRDLDHGCPPFAERQIFGMGIRLDVAFQLAEEHVIGVALALFQRLVTIIGIATANDELWRKTLHGFSQSLGPAEHMQAIGLDATCRAAIASHQSGSTRLLHDGNQHLCPFLEGCIVKAVLRNDDGRDISATQRILQRFRLMIGVVMRRHDQNEAATVFGCSHRFFHFLQTERFPRNLHSFSYSNSDRPDRRKDQPSSMLHDFHFFLVAIPAVILVGLSKGGLGGALALMGVPLMALAVPPVQAAAIFLPILVVMDLIALIAWRKYNHRQTLLLMLPGAIAGITLGWAMSSMISADAMRLVVASVTIIFVIRYFFEAYRTARGGQEAPAKDQNPVKATIWSSLSGYASFVAHAGGPPFQIYVLPLKLDPKVYTGLSVRFFAIMNAIKLIPYFALGALDSANLTTSAMLLPVAMVATFAGAKVVKYMKPAIFYPLMYAMAFMAALKLLWDGLPL